ncbi:melatonin receptor type 1C-like [Lytechinus pictus]|uniref:melatonin receptor type 1C-like n=1 Tax=Lytechinus pictus TaxID=7653 RepID=UPI0030B9D727
MATTVSRNVSLFTADGGLTSCTKKNNLNHSNDGDNGPDDDDIKMWVFLFVTIFSLIMGLVGNVLIIGAVFAERRLRVLSNAFIVNLAIADLYVSTFINAFALVGLFKGETYFTSHHPLCNFIGATCIICCVCSLWSIAAIAVNRYIAICHRLTYRRIYNKGNLWIHLMFPWLGGVLLDIPNFAGWNSHKFIEEYMMCTYDIKGRLSYVLFLTIMAVGLPIVVISFSYICIYIYAYSSSHELKKFAGSSSMKPRMKKKLRQTDVKLLRSISILLLAYTIFWFPASLLTLVDSDHVVPDSVYMSVAFLAHFNSSVNSVIYGMTNENFRKGYKKFFLVALRCRRIDCSFNPETTGMASGGSVNDHNDHNHVKCKSNFENKFAFIDPDTGIRRELDSVPCNI